MVEETGEIIPCPSEKDFFYNAGLQFVLLPQRENSNPYAVLSNL